MESEGRGGNILYFIRQLIRTGLQRKGISLVGAYMVLLVVSSISIMLAEPPDSGLAHFGQALWWSVVTSTTVGYGDLFPVSGAGKIIAVLLPMFMGIGLGAAFITHVAASLIERRNKKMYGEKAYQGSNHIVLVGATDDTEYLIEQILKDENRENREIVLVADMDRHPFPDHAGVFFIKGCPDRINTLKKANAGQAQRIVIHTGSDEDTLFALINTLKIKRTDGEVTVRCLSTPSLDTFSSVHGDFEIVMQMTAEMLVQAMQDKVHIPMQILLRNNEDEEIYYVVVPDIKKQLTWWEVHDFLKQEYDYLTFAMQTPDCRIHVNPPREMGVEKGCGVWLIAKKRPMNMSWSPSP
ncbi:MAG: ion channel [Desulfobacterales bacterium]|nr:ion channel [Desulfobacterales bacterium]